MLDRFVRAITSGRGPDVMANRPGSVLSLSSSSSPRSPSDCSRSSRPTTRPQAHRPCRGRLGRRHRLTGLRHHRWCANGYVETWPDDDEDGIQEAYETGDAWDYFLVDESDSGVTVRSTRHPDDLYRYTATGVLVRDRVMLFHGPRPALQLKAGTGTLLLSFDSKEARDRAASELIEEAGLLFRDTGIAASPG